MPMLSALTVADLLLDVGNMGVMCGPEQSLTLVAILQQLMLVLIQTQVCLEQQMH